MTPVSRWWVFAAAVAVVIAGLALRRIPGPIGDLTGGVLYTVLLGLVVLLIVPAARPAVVGLTAFALSAGVEWLQLTPVPDAVTSVVPLARWVLGSTFAATDLLAYLFGGVVVAVLCARLRARRARQEEPPTSSVRSHGVARRMRQRGSPTRRSFRQEN